MNGLGIANPHERSLARNLLVNSLVGMIAVEVGCIFLHDAIQVTLAQNDEVVQTVALETAIECLLPHTP